MLYVACGVLIFMAGYFFRSVLGAGDPRPEALEKAEARAEKWKEAARLMGEELKKYKPKGTSNE